MGSVHEACICWYPGHIKQCLVPWRRALIHLMQYDEVELT
jgi:hypothetical protein